MSEIEVKVKEMARQLVASLTEKKLVLALAESCTAGLIADSLAEVNGASSVFWGSFVCYSPISKQRMLGIDAGFLEFNGLVSKDTAHEMAARVLKLSRVTIAAAVTGIAGPSGDGSDTPVGTVWVSVARLGKSTEKELHFEGDRSEIRAQATAAVLEALLAELNAA